MRLINKVVSLKCQSRQKRETVEVVAERKTQGRHMERLCYKYYVIIQYLFVISLLDEI